MGCLLLFLPKVRISQHSSEIKLAEINRAVETVRAGQAWGRCLDRNGQPLLTVAGSARSFWPSPSIGRRRSHLISPLVPVSILSITLVTKLVDCRPEAFSDPFVPLDSECPQTGS